MKKILFIIDSLTCGGAEKSLVSLLPLLDRSKYELNIWIRSRGGVFESLLPVDVNIIGQPEYSTVEKILFRFGGLVYSVISRFYKLIQKKEHASETLWKCQGWAMKVPNGDFDVVVAYQQGIPTYLVATKFHNVKKVAWINVNMKKAGYDFPFNLRYYNKFNAICPVSEELLEMMYGWMPEVKEKFTCVYDILNPLIIRKYALEGINEEGYNDKLCILTVGRLAPPKNHILAVRTAAALRDKGLDFHWYFIGEGGQREAIEREIASLSLQDNVRLLGLRTNPYAYMSRCDIYVQTSSFEGFGLTIAEAKILGKPVVSTNFEVVHDQLTDGVNGLISEMNPEALADAIMRLVNDAKLCDSLVNALSREENTTYLTELKKVERLLDEN